MSNSKASLFSAIAYVALLTPSAAHAYIGPGMGIGAFLVVLALLFGVLLFFIALIWFPIKRRFFSSPPEDHAGDKET